MGRWLTAAALGLLLAALWVGLWRQVSVPVLLGGVVLSMLPAGLVVWGKVDLRQPPSAWLRLDLWVAFILLVAARVTHSVTVTALVALTGRERSGIVAVPVSVRSDMARLLLLWSITVTPGTIALLLDGNLLYIHCLCQPVKPGLPGLQLTQRLLGGLWG
ncbi:MAG: Na+/H+ antiporter subunit E [Candidatus Bipolaricaulota bacterium]